MKYFGKVFVEFWDGDSWQLSAVWWWQYLLARMWNICGSATSDPLKYNYRHVLRKNVHFS